MALEHGTAIGSYMVEGILGRGGMAVVYRARHVESGRHVALKVLAAELGSDAEFVARFRLEGRLQAALEHPHVLTVYEAGESEHGLFLAMRLVPGSTLAALMDEHALDASRALALQRQTAEGLDAAHASGLVHRDVKPQNVLVGDADDAYLADFGLARIGGEAGLTITGKLLGTVAYLAPEVIGGDEAVPASDRYAFAAMLFACLSGTPVYPRSTEAAILYAHVSEPPPRISRRRPDLPAALDDVFARALAKDPGDRPASAVELVDAVTKTMKRAGADALGPPPHGLLAALEETTMAPLAQPAAPRRSRRVGQRTALAILAAAACGASAALGALAGVGDEVRAQTVPASLSGAQVLGSDLARPGRTVDCRGRRPQLSSATCTIVQARLPGKSLEMPEDGVIRRWAVRSAQGELALVVVRPRSGGGKQIARSENEFAGTDRGVHVFDANLAVSQGDLVGLVVVSGSGIGVRPGAQGTATQRWIPRLKGTQPATIGPGTGPDRELLLRVEYVPGGRQRTPRALTGQAARTAESGRVRVRRRLRFTNGRPVGIALVGLGDRFVLDEFVDGRRSARIDVPDFRPAGGRILDFEVYAEPAFPQVLGIYMEYANEESARIIDHFYSAFPREFSFVD